MLYCVPTAVLWCRRNLKLLASEMAPALSSASDLRVLVAQCNTRACIPPYIHLPLSFLHHIVNLAPNIALSKLLRAGDYKDGAGSSGVVQSWFLHLRNPVSGISSAILSILWLCVEFRRCFRVFLAKCVRLGEYWRNFSGHVCSQMRTISHLLN